MRTTWRKYPITTVLVLVTVLYEAISTATSLLALNVENLRRRGFINSIEQDANMTTLLLAALHIIPPLPLHLSYDLWRLKALKAINVEEETTTKDLPTTSSTTKTSENETEEVEVETENENVTVSDLVANETSSEPPVLYGRENLTDDWWSLRGEYQGVSTPDVKLYEDFLQDRRVVWNRPHIRYNKKLDGFYHAISTP